MCSNYEMKKHANAHVAQSRKASVTRSANFEKQRTSHYFLWNINIQSSTRLSLTRCLPNGFCTPYIPIRKSISQQIKRTETGSFLF